MSIVDTSINRADSGDDPLVPAPFTAQIIQETIKQSAVLSLARKVPMSSKTNRQPVLDALPEAYFVDGDTGLKQTSSQQWANLNLVAEEMAVIVPIPEAYLADSAIPIWSEVTPRIAAAFGRKIDLAAMFGVNKPGTWGPALIAAIESASNDVAEGTTDDLAGDIALLAQTVAEDGFMVNGFAAAPGFGWRLIGMRTEQGVPIYAPVAGDQPAGLYGRPFPEIANGGWDPATATVIGGDWSKAILGVRQDITFKMFTEGVISDDDGAVVLNLMQQDSVALRAVMRVAWQVANPITEVNDDANSRFAFGALEPVGS